MSDVLADTHTVLWYLFEPKQLSAAARSALSAGGLSGGKVQISAITLIEVIYLVEKFKLPAATLPGLVNAVSDPSIPVKMLPIDVLVAQALQRIPRAIVPDMPDRIIGATALVHGLPLVTADRKLQAAPIQTIW